MNEDVSFILGALEDGYVHNRANVGDYGIEFDQTNKEWLQVLSAKFQRCFNKTSNIKITKKGYRLRICSKDIYNSIRRLQNDFDILKQNLSFQE